MSIILLCSIILTIFSSFIDGQKIYPCATNYRYPHETEQLELTCYFYFMPVGTGEADHRIVSYHNKYIENSEDENVYELSFKLEKTFEFPKTIFWKFPNAELITVDQPGINRINKKTFDGAENLKQIVFRSNSLEKLENQIFLGAENLEDLDLSDNKIQDIENEAFKGLGNLEKLNLSGNRIEVFQDHVFEPLIEIKILDLTKNKIESLQDRIFTKNSKLEMLFLSENRISVIPTDLFSGLKQLNSLDLRKNICIDSEYPEKARERTRAIEKDLRPCSPPKEVPDNQLF